MRKPMKLAVALAMVVQLTACGTATVSRDVAKDGSHANELIWPSPDSVIPMHKGGTYPTAASLRGIAAGMNKQQIMARLGPPHFHEGVWGVREWNYLFNLHKPGTDEVVQCQYKILFDEQKLARSFYWQPASCADLLLKPSKEVAAVPAAQEQSFTLSADALFAFGKADIDDIRPEGRRQLDDLAARLVTKRGEIKDIHIVGYTDRLGSDSYNARLSERRAYAVKHYFAEHQVPEDLMVAEGHGAADAVVECAQSQRAVLIDCLAPNRRVVVKIEGAQK